MRLNGTLNRDTPDLGELANGKSRDQVIAFCSSVKCAGTNLMSIKGVPVRWSGKSDYCDHCRDSLYFQRVSCQKAKEHLAVADARTNRPKRKRHGA